MSWPPPAMNSAGRSAMLVAPATIMDASLLDPTLAAASVRYADVALDRPLNRTLSYQVPGGLWAGVRIGSIVEAPLRGGTARGIVTALHAKKSFRGRIKPIARHLTPDFTLHPEEIELARWLADYYWSTLGEALADDWKMSLTNDLRHKLPTGVNAISDPSVFTISSMKIHSAMKLGKSLHDEL